MLASSPHAHISLITHQCGRHHLFKPLGLGLVVEVHTAHEIIAWEKPTATIMPSYLPSCLHHGCPLLSVPMVMAVPLMVVVAKSGYEEGKKRRKYMKEASHRRQASVCLSELYRRLQECRQGVSHQETTHDSGRHNVQGFGSLRH